MVALKAPISLGMAESAALTGVLVVAEDYLVHMPLGESLALAFIAAAGVLGYHIVKPQVVS